MAKQPNGKTRISHSGGVRGFGSIFARWIEEDVVIVVLSNGKKNPYEIEAALERVVF